MTYRIYRITNLINGKLYIGLTTTEIKQRWSVHKSETRSCPLLGRAIRKYGHNNFIIEEIYNATNKENMKIMEAEFIKLYNTMNPNGYNLTCGGEYHEVDKSVSMKLSKASLEYWNNDNKKKASVRLKERISNMDLDTKKSFFKGARNYIENKKCKVIGVSYTTFDYIIFETIQKAHESGYDVTACLNGRTKTTKGYVFYRFIENKEHYIDLTKKEFSEYTRGSKSWEGDNRERIEKIKKSNQWRYKKIKAENRVTGEILNFDSKSAAKRYGFSGYGIDVGKQGDWILQKFDYSEVKGESTLE